MGTLLVNLAANMVFLDSGDQCFLSRTVIARDPLRYHLLSNRVAKETCCT